MHRKALLEVLAAELLKKNIHFSCKITSISTEDIEGSSIAVLETEDGSIIKTKVCILEVTLSHICFLLPSRASTGA